VNHDRAFVALRRLFVGVIVAMVAFCVAVYFVGKDAKNDLRQAQENAAAELRRAQVDAAVKQTRDLRAGCERGIQRDYELYATNEVIVQFASDAQEARREDGNYSKAAEYSRSANKARGQAEKIEARLPESQDPKVIEQECIKRFPLPVAE
jgi:hypothetical protein